MKNKKFHIIEQFFLLFLTIFIRLKYELEILKNENNELKLKNIELTNVIISQKKWSEQENERFEYRFTKILSNLFTKTQIDMLLNPKKKVYKWQPEDISSAITLRSISPKAYRYLREEKHFPLVGLYFYLYKFI